jgi:hypothetical protein
VRSYFRVSNAPRALTASLVFPFDLGNVTEMLSAWHAARYAANQLGCEVIAWRRPELPGPWCDVAEVGSLRDPGLVFYDDEEAA